MNKLRRIFNIGINGLVEKERGKGLTFFKFRIQNRTQRMRMLMEDGDVQFLMLMAYNQRGDDLLTGEVVDTGLEVANKIKEYVL